MPPDPRAWDVDPSRLAGTRFATVRFFDELGSTNTELVEDARAGAPVLCAAPTSLTLLMARAGGILAGELGREHVISVIRPANVASIRVAERLGERLEGHTTLFGSEALLYGISRSRL